MLEERIIHEKNMIFFKLLVTSIVLLGMIKYLPELRAEKEKTLAELNNATQLTTEVIDKISSFSNFGNSIYDLYDKYQKYRDHGYDLACMNQLQLLHNLEKMQAMFKLSSPIDTSVTTNSKQVDHNARDQIEIYSDVVTLRFSVPDLETFRRIVAYVETILPEYANIEVAEADMNEVLSPSMLLLLGKSATPDLIVCKISIALRNLNITE